MKTRSVSVAVLFCFAEVKSVVVMMRNDNHSHTTHHKQEASTNQGSQHNMEMR
jgi:hypothetical protein